MKRELLPRDSAARVSERPLQTTRSALAFEASQALARPPRTWTANDAAALQRAIGNRAVQRFCALARRATPAVAATASQSLPSVVQERMSRAFGTDFSNVRVHEGEEVRARGAIAYTRGERIDFAPGRYDPWTGSGERVLRHELAHVVQQRAGRVASTPGQGARVNSDPALEAEADRWANAPLGGLALPQPRHTTPGSDTAQMLKGPEYDEFIAWAEKTLSLLNVREPERTQVMAAAKNLALTDESLDAVKSKFKAEAAKAWATPGFLLGNTYLTLRNTLRPARPNTASWQSPACRTNCSMVAVAVLVGKTTSEVAKDLGCAPDTDKAAISFLGKEEAEKYGEDGNLNNGIAKQKIGTLEQYVRDQCQSGKDKETLRNEFQEKRLSLDKSNDDIMEAMGKYVLTQLGEGVRVSKRGSKKSMLTLEQGITDMKGFSPGTQFVVYLAKETANGSHFVYANNLGGKIHFVDYQPLVKGLNKTSPEELAKMQPAYARLVEAYEAGIPDKHPHTTDAVTPPPFLAKESKETFAKMCFLAFEVTAAHASAYIKSHPLTESKA